MAKRKTRGGKREGAGRKTLAELGVERRERKVLAAFTPTEYARLAAQAERVGVTVSELVALRAVG